MLRDTYMDELGNLTPHSFELGFVQMVSADHKMLVLNQSRAMNNNPYAVHTYDAIEYFDELSDARAYYYKLKEEMFPKGTVYE